MVVPMRFMSGRIRLPPSARARNESITSRWPTSRAPILNSATARPRCYTRAVDAFDANIAPFRTADLILVFCALLFVGYRWLRRHDDRDR